MKIFDLTVIGAGPGGYVAAIKAAQMGLSVALIEKKFLGGTCLNVGCIPTKALISHAKVFNKIKNAKNYGINVDNISFDFAQMDKRKNLVVSQLRKGIEGLIKANRITLFQGHAQFISSTTIQIINENSTTIETKNAIIATGSEPLDIPSFPYDGQRIHNSTSILNLKTLPKTLTIIGGGYIGCEFASLYRQFDVDVTIIEAQNSILSTLDDTIITEITSQLKKQNITILNNEKVSSIQKQSSGVTISLESGKNLSSDMVLVSIGRKITSNNLGLEKIGVNINNNGAIPTNNKMQTNVPGIYAIGDVTGTNMLAHVASHQGIVAAMNIAAIPTIMHYDAVPSVIFTFPEIGCVGLTLKQAQDKGYDVISTKFPFLALGKAIASNESFGFAYIIAEKKSHRILGAHIIGSEASDLISEMTLAIKNELTLECISQTIHAHPTLSEIWMETANSLEGYPIHMPPKRVVHDK